MPGRRLLPLIPALWASLFDITLTIIHQPKEYWEGNLNKANEGNPIGKLFMNHHVSGIFLISILWLFLIVIAGYYLPRKVAKVFLLFALIAHSYGASTWISPNYGIMYFFLFILINSILYLKVEGFAKELPAVRSTRV